MLVVLIGKTCSGKDTIAKKLIDKGWEKVVTYTTRPMRSGEIDGKTYHFITDKEFKDKIKSNFFTEYKSYNSANSSIWYYGSALKDNYNSNNHIIILTPEGYKDLLKTKIPHISVYIHANNETITQRLKKRGDNKNEAERRLQQDNIDFKDVYTLVNQVVINNAKDNLEDVVKEIEKYVNMISLFLKDF